MIGLVLVIGPAGAGKTRMLKATADDLTAHGRGVFPGGADLGRSPGRVRPLRLEGAFAISMNVSPRASAAQRFDARRWFPAPFVPAVVLPR